MTVTSNISSAIVDLKAEFDTMGFLNPGSKTEVDQDLIDEIQDDMDTLVTNYSADFETSWEGEIHEPTAVEIAHWIFDEFDHDDFTITLYPDSGEALVFITDVPFPWR